METVATSRLAMLSKWFPVLGLLLTLSLFSYGQPNVTAVEYFFDNDPGPGNGTSISITPGQIIDLSGLNIPTTSLVPGMHTFNVRAKDANNVWGFYETRSFSILSAPVTPPPTPNIVAMEYFFDTDPGQGAGTAVAFAAGTTVDIANLDIPISSLSVGWHLLVVRVKDANNVWSFNETRNFFVRGPVIGPPPPTPNTVAMEYFFDTDPGPGAGTPVTVTPGMTVDIAGLDIPVNTLTLGWHTLNVRAMDAYNAWSFYETRNFFVRGPVIGPPPPPPNTVAMEYFFDSDPGPGAGTSISITTGTAIDVSGLDVPMSLAVGWHTFSVRSKDANNNWGFYETRNIFVRIDQVIVPPPSPITAMEFFYDNDPGPGSGQAISISSGTQVDAPGLNLVNSLAPGYHSVFVRTLNQKGDWGFYESRQFLVAGPVNAVQDLPPTPIVGFEFFVDNDPGAGLGTFISKPPSTLFDLVNEPLNVGSISQGVHKIGLRAQNQNGTWSLTEMGSFTVTPPCTIITAPTANNVISCITGPVTMTATGAGSGQTYRWYADNTTLTPLFTGSPYVTPVLSVNTVYFVSVYDPASFCESARTQVTAILTGIPKPTLNLTGSLTVCQGNSVVLTAPPGFSNYTWSNGLTTQQITVATAGAYSVTVGNGSCTSPASDPFTFNVNPLPAKPVVNATGGGSLCGGPVTLSAPAGFPTYSWSSGGSTQNILVSTVGNFTVTVTDANGCQSIPSDVFTVTSTALTKPTVTVTGNTTICGGGSVQLSAPGGFTGYNWSNGATTQTINPGTAGSYTVVVSNGSCTSTASDPTVVTVVSTPSKPIVTVSGSAALCNGSFAVLSAPLGFSNYLWSDGETTRQIVVSLPGSFTVQVGNAATCLSVASDPTAITLTGLPCGGGTVPPAPNLTSGSRCGTGTLSLSASGAVGSQVYRWYDLPAAGTLLFTGATFVTPSLSATTAYYGSIYDPSQLTESSRVAVSANIVNIAAPVIAGPSTVSICAGSSTLLSAPTGFFSYLWSNGATTQQIQISTAGGYSVQVGDGICMSPSSNVINVSIVPAITKPVVTVTGNTILCGSGTVQLSAPVGYTYAWSNGASTQSITVSSSGNYFVTISNGVCTSPASDPVDVTSTAVLPKPAITLLGSSALCVGGFAVLTAPNSAAYVWSTGETSRQIVVNSVGSYSVQVGNASNCLSIVSDNTIITSTGVPCGGSTAPGAPLVTNAGRCGAGTVTLTAGGASGGQVYRWYDAPTAGNLLFTGSSFVTPSVSATTNYYATIFDSVNGESGPATATASVTILPAPVLGGPSSLSICAGSSTLLSAPQGFIQYLWSNGATTQQLQVTTAGSYSVQAGNGSCLSPASNTIVVTVSTALTKPSVTVVGNTTFCGTGSADLLAPAGYQYQWSTGATSQQITVSSAGNYSVSISNGTCTSPLSDNLVINAVAQAAKPTIQITGNQVLCNGSFVALDAPAGYSSYLWSTGETISRIVVSSAGNYSVRVGNAANCLSTVSDDVAVTTTGQPCGGQVLPPPPPSTFTVARCDAGTVVLNGSGATGIQQYRWYSALSGGSLLFNGPVFTTPVISASTTYYLAIYDPVTLLESTRINIQATVVSLPKPAVNNTGSLSICAGTSTLLSAPTGFSQYIWSTGAATQQLQVTSSGSYSVKVSNGLCVSPASDNVVVTVAEIPSKPVVTITGSATFCSQGSVDLTGPAGFTYLWSNGAVTQKITLTESAVVSLVVKNGLGCSSLSSDPIVITKLLPPCKPNTPPVILPISLSVKIEGTVSADLTKYVYDDEENIDYTRLQTLTTTTGQGAKATIDGAYNLTLDYKGIKYSGPDKITLEVYDLFNLRAQRIIDIDVVGEVIVYNGVTPDGDGVNDFFYIEYLDVIQNGLKNKVTIFDRWGDLVFEITDYNNIDRTFAGLSKNGQQLPPGTYFYRIDFLEGKPVTGYITLKQ